MKIKYIKVQNYGPFAVPTRIEFDPEVTVLTGANDTGKTSVLRLINMMWTRRSIEEDEANIDHMLTSSLSWKEDNEIMCTADFQCNELTYKFIPVNLSLDDSSFHATFQFAPNGATNRVDYLLKNNNEKINIGATFARFPTVVYINPTTPEINPIIDVQNANPIERKLLELAFGLNPLGKLTSMSPRMLVTQLRSGSNKLTNELEKVIPKHLGYEFLFDRIPGTNTLSLSLEVRDSNRGSVPIHLRGAGFQKIVSIACQILDKEIKNEFIYLLIDEPENSLHADAQHQLRRFLEEIGKKDNFQVVLATHSPAMINPLRGNSVRLLRRTTMQDVATTIVENHPFTDNFLPVRTSLGLSISDSLIYGPISVVTEGLTEVFCIPIILNV